MKLFLFILAAGILVALGVWIFLALNRRKADFERTLNMVFLEVRIPKKDSKEDRDVEGEQFSSQRDFKEISCQVMAQFYEALYSIYLGRFQRHFVGQDFLSFEYAVIDGLVHFYIVCPREIVSLVEKQLTAFFPESYVEEKEDYNIFQPKCEVVATYIVPTAEMFFPIKTYEQMTYDPLNSIVNSLSKIGKDEGAAIQIMVRPKQNGWQAKGRKMSAAIYANKSSGGFAWYNPLAWISGFFNLLIKGAGDDNSNPMNQEKITPIVEEEVKMMDKKNSKPGFEVIIRLVSSAKTKSDAAANLGPMISAFAQYDTINANGVSYTKYCNQKVCVRNFIYRNFTRSFYQWLGKERWMLSSDELASLFHLPNIRFNKYPSIAWQNFKVAPLPSNVPEAGLLLGHNIFRGVKKPVFMNREDRFRHFYVIGQTGTGKSSIFQTMIRQDLRNGDGICVIDPHGSLIEDLLPYVPRSRADDVIIFDPSDMERPLGLNMLEGDTWEEKEMVALDAMNIMIKLFNEEIFGPRIQDYFRNGCLTLMSDPAGAALTDIVRLFTDDDFSAQKRQYVKNPIVASFWDNQMAKTGAREKQEMIPYFAAKFGQFVTNTMMRNIIGQTKSAFDFSKVMQEGKILFMNLSKGSTGEINSKLLGLIIVQKIQMAALKREKLAKSDRRDFFLYIDEFQNYVTDSIESILSEARKYRLSLNIAHQYLAQLEDSGGLKKGSVNLKDAIFGNVGTMMCYKIGAQDAEHMAKEMAPVFSQQDLVNIDKYKAVMKLSIETQPSRPFSIIPQSPYEEKGDNEVAEALKQLSRLKYGREREFAEREILRRIGAVE